jgi:hypothetical protein
MTLLQQELARRLRRAVAQGKKEYAHNVVGLAGSLNGLSLPPEPTPLPMTFPMPSCPGEGFSI